MKRRFSSGSSGAVSRARVDVDCGARDHPHVKSPGRAHAHAHLPTGPVTFLFTDIEGSTRLSQELGEAYLEAIGRHHALLRAAIADGGGIEVSTEGDAFFAVFTDALGAVLVAAVAQRALAHEPWPGDASLRVRMGLHTGIAHLGGDDYAGVEVNRAARIAAAGHGGQVLVSASTAEQVAGTLPAELGLRDLGAILLKDFDDPQRVTQLEVAGLPQAFPPLRAPRPGSLPQPLTSFLGREEVERAVRLVRRERLLTLTGPGGTGKTRISIEAARQLQPEFPGGAWFVPLETIRDPDLVLPQVADQLGLVTTRGRPLHTIVAEAITDTPTLLILDNLEQVVAIGPELVRLLEHAPGLHVLASSREPLRVDGEQELPVPVLDGSLAVELFIDRARRVRPGFTPDTAERDQLRDLVERLDRLPLAIELAAARARRLGVAAIAEQVRASLVELDSGRRDASARQRTLRGAVAWSRDLLSPDERRTFDRFAVFAGGCAFGLMADVVDPGRPAHAVLDDIEALADKSLLDIREGPDDEPRARMLETIHAFAAERFEEDPEAALVRERHARRLLSFCEEIEPELTGERSDVALARMEAEHDNVRAALDWALVHEPAVGLRIGGAVWRFWQQRTHLEEGQRRLEELFEVAGEQTERYALGRGSTALGSVRYWQGDYPAAQAAYERAVEHYRAVGHQAALAGALYDLSYPVAFLGDEARAAQLNEESLRVFEAIGDEAGVALVKEVQAMLSTMCGDFELAAAPQREVVMYWRARGGLFRLSDSLSMLALIEIRLGHIPEAHGLLEEMREVQRRIRDRSSLAGALEVRALVAFAEGDPETAALCLGAVQGMRDRSPNMLVPSEVLGFYDPADGLQEALGERFEALVEAGRSMDPEEVFLTDGLAAHVV